MKTRLRTFGLVVPALVLLSALALPALAGNLEKIAGVIVEHAASGFVLREHDGDEIIVLLTDATEIKERKRNFFRRAANFAPEDLILGLNVEIEGMKDPNGHFLASRIRLTQDDLQIAETISSRVSPLENELQETSLRVVKLEGQLDEKVKVLSGDIEELEGAYRVTREEAKEAQQAADRAQQTADSAIEGVDRTNQRINALDNYRPVSDIAVLFAFDSDVLTPEAQSGLVDLAAQAKSQKGYLIEITGFSSSDGDEAYNRRLSERRAETVSRFLVESQEIPLHRIVTPHAFGESRPVADNGNRDGRQKNRRVEVRLLLSEGLSEAASGVQNPEIRVESIPPQLTKAPR